MRCGKCDDSCGAVVNRCQMLKAENKRLKEKLKALTKDSETNNKEMATEE
jgi:hypothetical protein